MRALHSRAAIAAAVAAALLCVASLQTSAAATWSQEYAVEYSGGSNYTAPGVWADKDGRVAVTWSSVGGGPPAAWVRAYIPQAGWFAAAQIGTNLAQIPIVHAAAWTPDGKLWIAFDSSSSTPDLNMVLYDPVTGLRAPETLGTARHLGVEHAELLSDGAGNFKVAWVAQRGSVGPVLLSSLRAGSTAWSAPVQIDNTSGHVRDLDASVLPTGEAAIIWSVEGGTSTEVWLLQTSVGGPPPYSPALVTERQGWGVIDTRVAMEAPGTLMAAWSEEDNSNGLRTLVSSTLRPVSNWSNESQVTQAPQIQHVDVAFSAGAPPMIVWAQSMGTGTVTCYSVRDAGNHWSTPAALHESPGSSYAPSLTAGPNGTAWAVWSALDNGAISVWARQYQGGWLVPQRLSQGPDPGFDSPRIAVDGRGAAWAVWTDGSPDMNWVLTRAAGLAPGEDIAHTAGAGPTSGPAWLLAAPLILVAAAVLVTFFVYRRGK